LSDTAARGTGVTLVAQALRTVLQFGSVVVLARLLTPEAFGLVAMVTAVIGVADLVRDFGLYNAAIRAPRLSAAEQTNLFWVNTGLGLACTIVAASLSGVIALAYSQRELTPIVLSLAAVFTLSGASTQFRVALTRDLRFGRLAAVDVIAQAVGVAVAITSALLGSGAWALVHQQLAVALVSGVLVASGSRFHPGLPRRDTSVRPFLRFGGSLLGTQGIWYVTKNVDNIVLGLVGGPAALGLYSRAYQLLMMPLNQINAPMTRVALPVLSAVKDDQGRYEHYLARVQLVACYVTASVFAVAAALSHPIVTILFGEQWSGVAPIFTALAIGGVFRAIAQLAYWIYLSRGRPEAQLRMLLVTGPVMVALIVGGAPWGAMGIAIGHSVAHALYWVVSLRHAAKVSGVPARPLFTTGLRTILLVSAPAAGAALLGTLVPAGPVIQLLVGCAAVVAYLGLAAAAVPRVREDLVVVVSFARKAVRRG